MKQLLVRFFMPRSLYDNGTNSPWTNSPWDAQSTNPKPHLLLFILRLPLSTENLNYRFFTNPSSSSSSLTIHLDAPGSSFCWLGLDFSACD